MPEENEKPSTSRIIAMMAVTSAIVGVGFLLSAPIPLIPGAVQWRVLAFLPCLFGILFGWRTGFVSGALGNTLWAVLGGYFNPATPIFDLIGVGLTGAIPGYFAKPEDAESGKGLAKATGWSLISVALIMIPMVAVGFELVGASPFTAALWTLSVSDIPPVVIGIPIVLRAVVPVLKERGLLTYRF